MSETETGYAQNYDDVSIYTLSPEREREMIAKQTECTLTWNNREGHPLAVIMSYLERDGHFWLSATRSRKRVPALKRDPRSSLVITSVGTDMGPKKTITYKGRVIIHDDDADIKGWFYPAFAERLHGERGQAKMNQFVEFLDTPERVIIEFVPESDIRYDGDLMAAATPPPEGS
ncbi:MAG: pyridoxamine 5'-phosphate oxidase family protein [Acidimicrobiales bacterium]